MQSTDKQNAPTVSLEQAMHNVQNVIALFRGTFEEHLALRESLKVIAQYLTPPKPPTD